jgi:stage V sporulation protein B
VPNAETPSSQASAPASASAPAPAPAPAPASAPPPDAATARAAGRGGLAIAGAKVSFILFGFAQQLILSNLLGAEGYGEVSRVLAIVGIINNVVVATALQGVSRAVSSVPDALAAEAFGRTLRMHAALAALLSTAFALLAGAIASLVGAPHITTPLRITAAVILLYGIYAPLVGSLNGRRRFLDQAALDVGYGALRTAGIACGAYLFLRAGKSGVVGAILGFAAAAFLIIPAALTRSGVGRGGGSTPRARDYGGFLVSLAGGQIFLNLLLQTDFMLLSRFAGDAAAQSGRGADAADTIVAVYRGAQLFAFLPYQMLMSITFILFPMLARAKTENDAAAVTSYTKTGVRLAFLMTGLLCGTVSALAPYLLRFAFPVEIWENGAATLRVLALGMGTFAILGITCAALTSLGHERSAAGLTAGTVALVAAACFAIVPGADFGQPMLVATATATSIALALAAVLGGLRLARVARGFVAPLTLLRVGVATATTIALGSRLPWMGKLLVPALALVTAFVYIAVLVALREVGKADLATIRRAFGRRP